MEKKKRKFFLPGRMASARKKCGSGVIVKGQLIIPDGTKEIRAREYDGKVDRYVDGVLVKKADGNKDIFSVTVPGSVKKIGSRAFASCRNLRHVMLCEGIEEIEKNVFTDCENLRSVQIPASVTRISGWAFYSSGLTEPVFGASGEKLIYCPAAAAGEVYAVPSGVKEIGVQAFIYLDSLKKVVLPEGLQVIRRRVFTACGIEEIVLPSSIREVETGAFFHCRNLRRVVRPDRTDPVAERAELLRMREEPFVRPRKYPLTPEQYWTEPGFKKLAERCAAGDAEAMNEMADYFSERYGNDNADSFAGAAEQFWRYRAYAYGSQKAKERLSEWIREHPDDFLTAPFLSDHLKSDCIGQVSGGFLNALGFFFFDPWRDYILDGMDDDGVVLVSSFAGEDGPDEDGFGREQYYDWWYLDDRLNLPPGSSCIHGYSHLDRRLQPGKFEEERRKAAEYTIRKTLW
ncbi:MAG: leucine-rich repeat domain-containing protein [Clostridiales bacterium]|nr:leucine-rich repeat domain-containing protein [Clostridiales bacterium]